MGSYKGQESEMHTLYPACKMVRTNSKEEMSLLHPDGTLRGSCKNRSFNAKYVIFCLSASKEPSATNCQECQESAKVLVLQMEEDAPLSSMKVLAERVRSA